MGKKKVKTKFQKWMVANFKRFDDWQKFFCQDTHDDPTFPEVHSWNQLRFYLKSKRACEEALIAAEELFNWWATEDPKAVIDGLGPKDIARIKIRLREVWGWSYARKRCLERAIDEKGFPYCEKCGETVPKTYADHKVPCGKWDAKYIERMFVSSEGLQALCKKCHGVKTRRERIKPFF